MADCTHLQQALGETTVAAIHYVSAGIFILTLALICFVFAKREQAHTDRIGRARLHRVCGYAILAAVTWVVIGGVLDANIGPLTPLYVGEVVSVYAFGVSWIVKALDLLTGLLGRFFDGAG